MARFSKGILKAKRHVAPNGVVDVAPQRLKHWDEQQRLMLSRNLAPSVHWDHSDRKEDNAPVQLNSDGSMKRGANNAVGRLADFAINKDGDQAQITLDLPDELASDKAAKNIVGVSPVIVPEFRDGDGNIYRDCIVAYDLVTHPVDNTQTPFVPVEQPAIACSLRVFDNASSIVYKLADNPFEKKDGDGDGETNEGEGDTKADPPPAETPENPDMPPAKATDKTKLAAALAGLGQIGLVLPSDFDFAADGAIDILLASLNTYIAAQNKAEAEESSAEDDAAGSQGDITVADPGYAAMSLYAENLHRDQIKAKLDDLLSKGRCTPKEHESQLASLGTVKLSLDNTGKQLGKSDVETFIGHRESVPQGTFWDDKTRTKMSTVVEPPANMRSDLTSDEIQNTANWALGRKPAAAGK